MTIRILTLFCPHYNSIRVYSQKFYSQNCIRVLYYRIAGIFGGDKVWRIASSKVVGKKSLTNALCGLLNGLTSEKIWMV